MIQPNVYCVMNRLVLTLLCLALLATNAFPQDAPPTTEAASLSELSATALQLKSAVRGSLQQADLTTAREHLAALLDLYRAEHASNPSWRGGYQWSRRLAEVAHEYLRAGQLNDALAALGEAADLDVPLRKGFDNGWASAAGGLHRQLAALDSDERFEILNKWSLPTPARPTVRVLESLVPVEAPPPVFARAFGERPRDSSFPIAQVGAVTGLFSTAWELVRAADDVGRLRRLITELETLVGQKIPNAKHVLTLAKVLATTRHDDHLLRELTEQLAELRDNSPRPTERPDRLGFSEAWRYGHCRFDDATGRTVDFTPFTRWSGAAWQLLPNRPHSELGFARIDRTGGHPAPTRPCVRRWVAPADGRVFATGTLRHPAEKGNGVLGRIVSSHSGLHGEWTAFDGPVETNTDSMEVKAGDTIDLLVDAIDNNYYDTFVWMAQLRFETARGRRIYDSVADFCGPSDKHVLSDAVIAAACLEQDWLQPLGEGVLQKLVENTYDTDRWMNRPFEYRCRLIRPMLREAWATAVRKRNEATTRELLEDPGLELWVRGGGQPSQQHSNAGPRDIWLAHADHILHLAGSKQDRLFFKYPLTGDFEFSFETQTGGRPGTDGAVSYGGLGYEVSVADELFTASADDWRIGSAFSELTSRSRSFHGQYVGPPEFHRFALSSVSGRVTFSSNGQPVWSDASNDNSSPWIALQAAGDRTPIFRNLKISGDPVIPREVRLSDGDQLRSWEARFYDEPISSMDDEDTQLALAQSTEKQRISNANFRIPYFLRSDELTADYLPRGPALGPGPPPKPRAWFATDGVIQGPRRGLEDKTAGRHRLWYCRPLQSGESISYEFYYRAEEFEVHPALGRLAFLIEPAGVRLHWMTDGDREWTGLAEDNAVTEPFDRRGPKPLPLIEKDWNRMTIELADGRVNLSVNDQAIYEHKLRPEDDRTFGFYHDTSRAAAKVRNVVMQGDWPERLGDEQLKLLAAITDADRSQPDRLALNALFGDEFIVGDIPKARRLAAAMPLEERYEYLADWVLPNRNRATYRLYGTYGATNPAPPVADYTADETRRLDAAKKNGAGRIQTGGRAVAPALDLIVVAKQLGRLDSLRERVQADEHRHQDKSRRRSQLALLILIDIAGQDFEAADQRLEEFRTLAVEPPFLAADRWPEMLVFSAALRHRETYSLVGETVIGVTEREIRNAHGTGSDLCDRHLLSLTGAKRYLDEHEAIEAYLDDSPLNQWAPVSKVTAVTRGQGMPVARWSARDKSVFHYAGHANDFLYFQSPLRGNFQIDCEVTESGGWHESALTIGGQWMYATWSMKHFDHGDFRDQLGTHALDPPLRRRSDLDYVHYRIDVKDGVASTFISGRKIREQQLGADSDPWLGIRSSYGSHGGVRDLRIIGSPTIPAELRLLHDSQLTGWVPYYDETIGDETADWRYDGNEMLGRQHGEGESEESLVYYHRPMLEDGSIEYEFFYDGDDSHVHPALDRLAFLLEPGGVRIHWCTDAVHDRTGLSASNASDEPGNRRNPDRLPLKLGAWNAMKLALAGDTIDLTLNGQLVYQRQIEPSNMRQFGLFHFSDRGESRVRNIVWKGDWPKELPSLAEQELADVPLLAGLDAKLPQMELFEHDFTKDLMPLEVFQLPATNPNATLAFQNGGLHLTVTGTDPDRWHDHAILHRFSVIGDFDITASFDQLDTEFPKEHKYAGVALVAALEGDPYINLWLHRRRSGSEMNNHFIETTIQQPGPDGVIRWDTWKNLPNESTSGTFRLARRGKTIYYLYADGDSEQFRLHRTSELTDAPIKMNGLRLFTQVGGIGQTSVVWKQVTVRADEISPNPAEIITRRRETIAALARQLTGPLPKTALQFDGATSHVRIPSLNYDGSYPVTYELFATPDMLNSGVLMGDTQSSGAGLSVRNNYNVHAWNGSNYQAADSDLPATRFLRVHLAATLQDGQLRLFINGKQQRDRVKLTERFVASRFPIVVGASPSRQETTIDHPFSGVIDGARITKGVRYAEDFEPPAELKADKDTVVCLRFDEGEGKRAADSSGNGHHGVIRDATWTDAKALRRRAAQGLVEFGSDAVPALIEALGQENPDVQLSAITALADIGQASRPALSTLRQLAGHKDPRIRAAAEQATATIKGNTLLKSLRNLFK